MKNQETYVLNKSTLNKPDYPKPYYVEVCSGKYAEIGIFNSIRIRFGKSRSKDYRKVKFLASLLPNYIDPTSKNDYWAEFTIYDMQDFYIYAKVLKELCLLIVYWKYVEYYVNSEICYSDEFWLYINRMSKTIFFPDIEQIAVDTKIKEFNDKWMHERNLYSIVKKLFPQLSIIRHYRANWLENLELDIYIEEPNIGIEYQGIQHYKPLKHWGGEEGFIARRANDIRKKNLCQEHGTKLIEFTYLDQITEDFVKETLSKYL